MKKITLAICLLISCCTAFAQPAPDQRAFHTKVADILALFPAANTQVLNSNMETIAGLGEEGLVQMAAMLADPGKGDNTKMEYALAGYAFYVTQPGKEMLKSSASNAFMKALTNASNPETKAFLIRQLQITGNASAVTALIPYLKDARLCDPAARALVKIAAPEGVKAIADALPAADATAKITLTEALGDAKYTAAVPALLAQLNSAEPKLAKVTNYALAEIAMPAAATALKAAAAKADFRYDVTNATASYLTFISHLSDKKLADQLAQGLLAATKTPARENAYVAALDLYAENNAGKGISAYIAAATDTRPRVKNAGWKLLAANATAASKAQQVQVMTLLRTTDKVTKAAALRLMADNKVDWALPLETDLIKDKDPLVRAAAIDAAGRTGGAAALPQLLTALNTNDTITTKAVRNTLLIMPGNQVVTAAAADYGNMTAEGKTAIITLLAARKATDNTALVLDATKGPEPMRTAAFEALPAVSTSNDLSALNSLLLNAGKEKEIAATQQAIINTAVPAAQLQQLMSQAPKTKQATYFNILAGLGDKNSLQTILTGFNNGDAQTKMEAIGALASWTNTDAAPVLLEIARTLANKDFQDRALLGYISITAKNKLPADQKALMLRNALELTSTTAVQQKALKALSACKTYSALLLAGKYLDNAAVKAEAAETVMNIALADKSYNGNTVKGLLEKASANLSSGDADYQRQSIRKYIGEMPAGDGFVPMFNGTDLSGWKGLVENPVARAKMTDKALNAAQNKANETMRKGWTVKDGLLVFTGEGDNLCTEKKYGDFEMLVDWKITAKGDAGIYLRGSPQVQIWDTSRLDVGAQVGSGGLYNNQVNQSKPLALADNAIGEWNHFRIIMKGDRVTVYLNGQLVTDNTILENYWDRGLPIFPEEQIELQAHGTYVAYRDLYIKELPRPVPFTLNEDEQKAGYKILFDGTNMHAWTGNTKDYIMEDGNLVIRPSGDGGHGNLYTKDEYKDFSFRFEFQLTPGANNGLGVHAPLTGDAAYVGMELQILDNEADIYKSLHEYQYHGSVYGVIPAKRGFLKPVGEWNYEEAIVQGTHVKVILNGEVIMDGDIADARDHGTLDHKNHPGLKNETGHIGFLGHGSVVKFKNIRVKTL
ncbi:family 16 glycoside hydrolase [Chitinophaga sp. Hz27]|uniref:family 16 glycoside hydrolase n=1 Tax=Chitinophaga sp. Hz27 TaxID=3347169 RepID=UPI0035DF1B57